MTTTIRVGKFRDLGAIIKAVRESRGIRQEDLAEQLAMSRNYLQDLEKGKPTLYITRLFRAMNVLGITVSVTYTLKREIHPPAERPEAPEAIDRD
ncbi:helix-turn-helix protein [Glaciihabitans tibetensis]|uniref:Helix-turn-helix protein n=1 Tax=Glaciihabitans tibetensis TaxID=1266600 RepID=A0A2T0VCF9_9MICO|nr:helix-turn-helix domain-containing protein [Glaciihabitans tibetensis]PRY67869.1 helix-turn-helix protein [Glaciihabitans tibetensis]